MFASINIDAAVEHIKYIVDIIRCTVCDKASGTRIRYACGHTCCEDCAVVAADCSLCLTPPVGACRAAAPDQPYTQRVVTAINLLNIFQNEFHVDVYNRQRISEQLKVEKELFPECIQAPAKYSNKRKSYNKSNKENRLSQLPGEEISSDWEHKMEHSSVNVEKWLNKYARKPFADLNSNDKRLSIGSSPIKKQQNINDIENIKLQSSTRKRPHAKKTLSVVKNQPFIDKHVSPVKKKVRHKRAKHENYSKDKSSTLKYFKTIIDTNNDESGIVMDDEADGVIVIDDSQSMTVDKDMNAWLAVQEVENNEQFDCRSVNSLKPSEILPQVDVGKETDNKMKVSTKVPFFLKGYLSEKCIECNGSYKNESECENIQSSRDVSITVENKNYTAIIKVTNVQNSKYLVGCKQSVEVQTEISESMSDMRNQDIMNINLNHCITKVKEPTIIACNSQSQDLFKDDRNDIQYQNNFENTKINIKSVNKSENVVVAESDSDEELGASVSLEVTADVHRSCEGIEYGILSEVDNVPEHSKRPRRAARGYTPTSTDSSDKENYNPNRKKKTSTTKKKPTKK